MKTTSGRSAARGRGCRGGVDTASLAWNRGDLSEQPDQRCHLHVESLVGARLGLGMARPHALVGVLVHPFRASRKRGSRIGRATEALSDLGGTALGGVEIVLVLRSIGELMTTAAQGEAAA